MNIETTQDRIVIRLSLPAAKSTVWRVLVEPDHLGGWWGDYVTLEARPGGQLVERWSDGSREVTTSGRVLHVEPAQSLELTWADDDWPGETQVEFSLAEAESRTELVLTHSGWDQLPTSGRAALIRNHAAGWSHHLQNLADYVAELQG